MLEKKKLFNPAGDDSVSARRMIKGNTTNLFNLNEVKYAWAKKKYRVMNANFWIPEKVDLNQDAKDYHLLSKDEQQTFKSIISFLTFLDSVQTNNIPNIKEYITAPEVSTLLAIQEFQEVIHSQSYAYILESVIPASERNDVYELWKQNSVLLERNQYIANIYDEFIQNPSDENFARTMMANYVLESLYFYNGFIFFYSLAARNLMPGVSDEIRYINRDELTHVGLFQEIIKEINLENPGYISQDVAHELFKAGVDAEVGWTNSIIKSGIAGLTEQSTASYTRYLADIRLQELGFDPLYGGNTENPYKHFERLADSGGDAVKSNFFETTVTGYSQSTALDGWDEI